MNTAVAATSLGPIESLRTPELVNLTPHPIVLVGMRTTMRIPASGKVARVEYRTTVVAGYLHTVPVLTETTPVITGLPDARSRTYLIVSRAVLQACPHRADLFSPAHFERDENGIVCAARVLVTNPASVSPLHAVAR